MHFVKSIAKQNKKKIPLKLKANLQSGNQIEFGETSGSHGGEYEDDCLLEFCSV
jgi:hypothetical protein